MSEPTQADWEAAQLSRLNVIVEHLRLHGQLLGQIIEALTMLLQLKMQDPQKQATDNWKQKNPEVARQCRLASEVMQEKQTRFLEELSEKILRLDDDYEGDFQLKEIIEMDGHRLQHLGLITGILSTLGENNAE